jgi:hypothetical protein
MQIEDRDSLTYLFSFTFKQIVVGKEKIAKDGTEKHWGWWISLCADIE